MGNNPPPSDLLHFPISFSSEAEAVCSLQAVCRHAEKSYFQHRYEQ